MIGDSSFEIVEHIGIITASESGWTRELNRVSWNGAPAKYDIRAWNEDHSRMTRGITLDSKEMSTIIKLLGDRF